MYILPYIYLQCQVEENDTGIGVLFYLSLRQGELGKQPLNVSVVDETGKAGGELALGVGLVDHLRLAVVGDIVLAHLVHAVVEKGFTLVPSHFGDIL